MKRVLREQAKVYCFDRSLPPKLRVAPGEKFLVETRMLPADTCARKGSLP